MKESAFERKLVDGVKQKGGRAYKFVSPGTPGVPDRIVVMPGGRIIFVELKTTFGKLSAAQKSIQAKLRQLGTEVYTLYGVIDVEGFLDAL